MPQDSTLPSSNAPAQPVSGSSSPTLPADYWIVKPEPTLPPTLRLPPIRFNPPAEGDNNYQYIGPEFTPDNPTSVGDYRRQARRDLVDAIRNGDNIFGPLIRYGVSNAVNAQSDDLDAFEVRDRRNRGEQPTRFDWDR